jgi:hypothetical protein
MEIQRLGDEEKKAWLEEQQAALIESGIVEGEAKIALEEAINAKILEADNKLKEAQQKLLNERLEAFAGFFGGLSSLMEAAGEHNKAAAVAGKALAAAEAGINS